MAVEIDSGTALRRILFRFLVGLWLVLASGPSRAFAGQGLANAEERLLDIYLRPLREVVASDLLAFRQGTELYVSLAQFVSALEFPIEIIPTAGMAKGFFVEESRTFELNVGECYAEVAGVRMDHACDKVTEFEGELFVEMKVLSTWFPLELSFVSLKSRIEVVPAVKLPLQLAREREARGARKSGLEEDGEAAEAERKRILARLEAEPGLDVSYPSMSGQVLVEGTRSGVANAENQVPSVRLDYSGILKSRALRHEVTGAYGRNPETSLPRMSWLQFRRRDEQSGLLGPLRAREYRLWNVDGVTGGYLVAGGGYGVQFGNSGGLTTAALGEAIVEGSAEPGWDFELYRNDLLVETGKIGAEGRYFFPALKLFAGKNDFRVELYGPRGERRTRHFTRNLSGSILPRGAIEYASSLALRPSGGPSAGASVQAGLGAGWALSTGFGMAPDELQKDGTQEVGVSPKLIGSVGPSVVTLGGAYSAEGKGLLGGAVWFPMLKATGELAYGYQNFDTSSLIAASQAGGASAGHAVSLNIQHQLFGISQALALRQNWASGSNNSGRGMELTTGASLGKVNAFHTLSWSGTEARSFLSQTLSSRTEFSGIQFGISVRDNGTWTWNEYGAVLRFPLWSGVAGELGWTCGDGSCTQTAQLSRTASDSVQWGARIGHEDRTQGWSAGMNLSFSLLSSHREPAARLRGNSEIGLGMVCARVFEDMNANGTQEPGEPGVAGANVVMSGVRREAVSDSSGEACLERLPPEVTKEVLLLDSSVGELVFRGEPPVVRTYAGLIQRVVFPMTGAGEISGTVKVTRGGEAVSAYKIPIELRGPDGSLVKTINTDSVGGFEDSSVPVGEWTLSVGSEWLKSRGARSVPDHLDILIRKGELLEAEEFALQVE